jgi:hypothetical protein
MQQKYKVLSFAIIAALYMFLVPSTSQANFTRTHTPGETVGPTARPPILINGMNENIKDKYTYCENKLVIEDMAYQLERGLKGVGGLSYSEKVEEGWDKRVGLGYHIRYIQVAGQYCYYYKAGKSSGAGGPNTWRYDPK